MTLKRPEDDKWEVASPKTLFSNHIVTFLASDVTSPRTGLQKEFYRFEFPKWVNIVAITPEEEMVLIRQYRFGTGRLETEIPGGAVEIDEDPLAAGLRELLEETGFAGDNGRIIGNVCPNPAIQNNLCYTVLVENVTRQTSPTPDPMEDIEVFTVPVQEVFRMANSGAINHGLVLNGLMFYWLSREP